MLNRFTILAAVTLLVGCMNPALHYVRSSAASVPARTGSCTFSVSAGQPGPEFQEIGYIENIAYGETSELRETFGKTICQAGGDHVVTMVNGFGVIVRAVVYHKAN